MLLFLLLPRVGLAGGPVFSVERGLYDAAFELEIAASEDGGTVYYSADGSDPTTPYDGPITIDQTRVVRALEITADGVESATSTHTYLFLADVLTSSVMDETIVGDATYGPIVEDTLASLPTVSIVAPDGLNTSTETGISLEWIDPDGEHTQLDCGARKVGGHSVAYEKNSIRLLFREEYGNGRWEFDLYGEDATGMEPADEHDALTLRGGNHDTVFYLGAAGQHLRNFWMDETQLEMGHPAPHGRFAHLYIDGAYHGLYHVRERMNAAFLAEYLGGDEDDYEAINGGSAFDGSGAAWAALVASSSDFEAAREWLDVENFLDYMVLNFYAGNAWDWSPTHNWIAVGPDHAGAGGFRFHSSDSDICLYYPWTVNILTNAGPSYVWYYLLAEGHPDFRVALMDAIHRNLEADGPLTADNASARYERLAGLAEDAVVAESARWGQGWWDRDHEWTSERTRLREGYFPLRTDELLRQVREAGWYPLDAPELSLEEGVYAAGTEVSISAPEDSDAELWVSLDGEDPRLPGGERTAGAIGPDSALSFNLEHATVVKARLYDGDEWGPLAEAFYEVDETPPIALNEWNTVASGKTLKHDDYEGAGEDAAFGAIEGNGGDWIELLVLQDGLDLRGWRLTMEDRRGEAGELAFTDDPALADLRAGTILTVSEELPEDASYDPDRGDWRFHLRAGLDGSGRYVSAADFDVTHYDWRLTIWDADGHPRFGPAGETVAPRRGISSSEVGLLAADPSALLRRDSEDYADGAASTYGSPNVWEGGRQDLSVLRGEVEEAETGETGAPAETGETGAPAGESGPAVADSAKPGAGPGGCGCGSVSSRGGVVAVLVAALAARRRRLGPLLLLGACTGKTPGTQGESGAPEDSAPGSDSAPHDTGPSCYADRDRDGYGDPEAPVEDCAAGAVVGTDCDDADPDINPGAVELCDALDQDCDGHSGDSVGASSECAATSCLEVLEAGGSASGAYWIALPSGETVALWCDLETDGGGWTLGFLRNTASLGSQGGFGGGDESAGDLGLSPEEASASGSAVLAWIDLNAFEWSTLRVGAYAYGEQTWLSEDIPREDLRISFGEDGYLLYGGDSPYYWCGGDASYTDAGVGATSNPEGAPSDCKGHGSLGSGWDFSESPGANAGLTLCGADGSSFLAATWGGTWIGYGSAGGAQAIFVR